MTRLLSFLALIICNTTAVLAVADGPFLTTCQSANKTVSAQGFFDDVFDQLHTKDCQDAFDRLMKGNMLKLKDQRIENLEPLRDFPGGFALEIGSTNLEDLSALATMPKLSELRLKHTPSIDFTPLSAIKSLRYLTLAHLHPDVVEDVMAAIRGNEDIVWFKTDNAPLNEGAKRSLARLTGVKTLVIVGDRKLESLDFISPLANIDWLVIADTPIKDIKVIDHFDKLKVLQLMHTNVHDISPVARFGEAIYAIDIRYSPISDLTPLKAFTNIDSLWLIGLHLTQIPDLSTYKRLRHLKLIHNNIHDFSNMKKSFRVSWLDLSYNAVTDVTDLKDMRITNSLNLSHNPLGTTIAKTEENCPTDGSNELVAGWCGRQQQRVLRAK